MKNHFAWIAACAAVLVTSAACENDAAPGRAQAAARTQASAPAAVPPVPAGLARVDFHVEGMTCGGCEAGTRGVLRKVDGVQNAGASYADSRAWAVYDPAKASPEQMMAAIRELGYTPTVVENRS